MANIHFEIFEVADGIATKSLVKNTVLREVVEVPFVIVEEVPIFSGCEKATDKKNLLYETATKTYR